jgi:transcriptional regulator with PAS, ATPase and Fis domain
VLQDKTYEPLGGTRSETADVRVVAATNVDLLELVRKGAFREDLYYRVNVLRLELPPLRRRKEDIPILVQQFIDRFEHLQNKSIHGVSTAALSLLMAHDWPGNVRELENVIERSSVLCNEEFIQIEHLPEELTGSHRWKSRSSDIRAAHDLLDAQEIHAALERNGFNRTATARELGIHKSTLFRRIKRLGVSAPRRGTRSHPSQE